MPELCSAQKGRLLRSWLWIPDSQRQASFSNALSGSSMGLKPLEHRCGQNGALACLLPAYDMYLTVPALLHPSPDMPFGVELEVKVQDLAAAHSRKLLSWYLWLEYSHNWLWESGPVSAGQFFFPNWAKCLIQSQLKLMRGILLASVDFGSGPEWVKLS